MDQDQFKPELGPNVRLRLTVAEEMRLDPNEEIFTDELHSKYIAMQKEAERQLQAAIKGVVYADIGLSLLLFGKNVKIPGIDFGIQDIPAAIEVLTVLASFCFLVLCQSFANSQCYLAVIDQFSIRKALKRGIDPDFLTFGNVFSQIFIKAFRADMNIYGSDFFIPRKRYRAFYHSVLVLVALSWLSVLAVHCIVVGVGVWNSIGETWLWWPFAGAVLLIHVTGIAMNIFIDFKFDAPPREQLQEMRRQEGVRQTR
ncbi:hypothetical protein ASF91_08655 [Rhizobium sp. Leaf155]|nr:hypothetical protein ASF91_08655 [Rhizobium sp. Leaf155]